MGNPQKVKFRGVADFLAHLPPDELELVEYLRAIVLDCLPQAREKLAYNVPFYYLHRRVCCIWPASVPWGKLKAGVMVGFMRGSEMGTLPDAGATTGLRRTVYHHVSEVDEELLRTQLYEAMALDEADRLNRPGR